MDWKKSDLEKWLRKKNMSTTDFAKIVGCSRPTLLFVKRGIAISAIIALKIHKATDGDVLPITRDSI